MRFSIYFMIYREENIPFDSNKLLILIQERAIFHEIKFVQANQLIIRSAIAFHSIRGKDKKKGHPLPEWVTVII